MKRVIVIDDEQIQRQGLVSMTPWEEVDCQVVGEAANAREGMELIRKLQPDIVIVDIRMPGESGLELIEKMQRESHVEYIILSGYGEFSYAQQAIRLGVRNYLLKPVNDDELLEAVRKAAAYVDEGKKRKKMELEHDVQLDIFRNFGEGKSKNQYLEKAIRYIEAECQENLTIRDVAEVVKISSSYLHRLFVQYTNYTFGEYLTMCRIRRAIRLLHDGDRKIYEIAELCGYKDTRYFSMVFRRITGLTPSEYKEGRQA